MTQITPRAEAALTFIDHDGERIAIRHRVRERQQPTILFLPGYGSDMAGIKALAIDAQCAEHSLGCLRIDYSGTGLSSGAFADGTLERWLDQVLVAIDSVSHGKVIIVGSSMGGWIALHAALRRPDRVAALLGISAAPDFTEWGFTAEDKAALQRDGRIETPRPDGTMSARTLEFWQSGQAMRLLDGPIPLPIPVRLVHGAEDNVVPTSIALRLLERIEGRDVQLRLIKSANHNLSTRSDLAALRTELAALVDLALARPQLWGDNPSGDQS